jgi:hypothetical protein
MLVLEFFGICDIEEMDKPSIRPHAHAKEMATYYIQS